MINIENVFFINNPDPDKKNIIPDPQHCIVDPVLPYCNYKKRFYI
jgi:hypothetical protein